MANGFTLSNIPHFFSLPVIAFGPQEYIKNTHTIYIYLPHQSISVQKTHTHTYTHSVAAHCPQTDLWP